MILSPCLDKIYYRSGERDACLSLPSSRYIVSVSNSRDYRFASMLEIKGYLENLGWTFTVIRRNTIIARTSSRMVFYAEHPHTQSDVLYPIECDVYQAGTLSNTVVSKGILFFTSRTFHIITPFHLYSNHYENIFCKSEMLSNSITHKSS